MTTAKQWTVIRDFGQTHLYNRPLFQGHPIFFFSSSIYINNSFHELFWPLHNSQKRYTFSPEIVHLEVRGVEWVNKFSIKSYSKVKGGARIGIQSVRGHQGTLKCYILQPTSNKYSGGMKRGVEQVEEEEEGKGNGKKEVEEK